MSGFAKHLSHFEIRTATVALVCCVTCTSTVKPGAGKVFTQISPEGDRLTITTLDPHESSDRLDGMIFGGGNGGGNATARFTANLAIAVGGTPLLVESHP